MFKLVLNVSRGTSLSLEIKNGTARIHKLASINRSVKVGGVRGYAKFSFFHENLTHMY